MQVFDLSFGAVIGFAGGAGDRADGPGRGRLAAGDPDRPRRAPPAAGCSTASSSPTSAAPRSSSPWRPAPSSPALEFAVTNQQTIIGGVPLEYGEIATNAVALRPHQPGLHRRRHRRPRLGAALPDRDRPLHVRDRRQPGGRPPLRHPHPRAQSPRLRHRRPRRRRSAGSCSPRPPPRPRRRWAPPTCCPPSPPPSSARRSSSSGEFNVPGTVVGVLFLGVIQTGLTMLNLTTDVINIVQGAILAVAVLMSRIGARLERMSSAENGAAAAAVPELATGAPVLGRQQDLQALPRRARRRTTSRPRPSSRARSSACSARTAPARAP